MGLNIFVVGVTGQQGGAVARALLDMNKKGLHEPISIHALIRPESKVPEDLVDNSNVKVVQGHFDDVTSIKAAAASCHAAFLNISPVFTDPKGEARHAKNLVEACASVPTLKRIVYSSSGAMHRPADDKVWSEYVDKYPEQWMSNYMKSKKACEASVIGSSSKDFEQGWSIVRSNTFLSNFLTPWAKFMYPELETKQSITTALKPDLKISFLDSQDLGPIIANMLICETKTWNENWKGKFVPVAKENLTVGQLVDKMNTVLESSGSNKHIDLIQLTEEDAKVRADSGDLVVASQIFQNNYQRSYALDEVKDSGIDLEKMVTVDAYLQRETQRLVETVGGA